MNFVVDKLPTKKEFLLNLEEKMSDSEFNSDIHMVLRPGIDYDKNKAFEMIRTELIEKM